ncbi:MAG: bifunctional [glutamate--ammonia ligase]-adenylyl-L-tyrosine phosphorylase/[glutamate--ammonia-ligase] adenylyltransferase [Candidatus Sumerlaeia bacterium]|nr:bifunctional [glutamate--ammonia ligase]-adenylyl-L-tyrosine phosphorylase/[glutamate--ammonia-ligase] adenylyltransferase [Candidatus Sumerlaeia bacterium]
METAHIHAILRADEGEDLSHYLRRAAAAYGWPHERLLDDLRLLEELLREVAENGDACELASHVLRALSFSADSSMSLRHLVRFLRAHGDRMHSEVNSLRYNSEHLHFLSSLFSFSVYLSEIAIQYPSLLSRMMGARGLNREKTLEDYRSQIATALEGVEDRNARRAALTVVKKQELFRIGIRELRELGDTRTLCRELSAMAQAMVETAYNDCLLPLIDLHGRPANEGDGNETGFCVYAMGKFGAGELNFSSDIDLVFLYDDEGETAGGDTGQGDGRMRKLKNHEFFNKLARELSSYLNDRNTEGFLFRVDLRLRPDGSEGPLARSRSGYMAYLLGHAAPWEKIAYMKARCIAGDMKLAANFDEMLEQFVYTDNDPSVILPEVAHLKRRIDFERLTAEDRELDIKRGRGGIREVEFIVAALQLLHNNRWPELRTRPTLEALGHLKRLEVVREDEARLLEKAYLLYRRIEHTLQMMNENQTHRMPSDAEERRRLALRCGFLDVEEFEETLNTYRRSVRDMFGRTFGTEVESKGLTLLDTLFGEAKPTQEILRGISTAGLGNEEGFQALRRLARGTAEYSPSARARQTFGELLPTLLEELEQVAQPRQAVQQLDRLLHAAKGFSWVYEMCQTHPPILKMFLRTLGFGPLLGRLLVAHPEWLDEIFRNGGLREDRTDQALAQQDFTFPGLEMDTAMQQLRRIKTLEGFLISVQEVLAIANNRSAARRMTQLAEKILDGCANIITRDVLTPMEVEELPVRWAILGMGGLGDHQVHFHGDLDIAFVVEKDEELKGTRTNQLFDRIFQRLIGDMNAVSPDGQLWKVDARLRPDGASGPLVASYDLIVEYYRSEAGLWEWQALTKARPVAGNLEFGTRVFNRLYALAGEITFSTDLAAEIREMRSRIESSFRLPRTALLDLKRGPGGVIDMEFLVQYYQLSHPGRAAELFPLSTEEALEMAISDGWIDEADGKFVRDHLALIRTVQRQLRILWETNNDYYPADEEKQQVLARGLKDQLQDRIGKLRTLPEDCLHMRGVFDKWTSR